MFENDDDDIDSEDLSLSDEEPHIEVQQIEDHLSNLNWFP